MVSEEFGAEWRARNASGETLTVMTPFHRLALAARNAAFKGEGAQAQRNRLLRSSETGGKLTVWVTLKGSAPSSPASTPPCSSTVEAEIKPTFVQNERTALRTEDGGYAARCLYVFPADALGGKSRFTLVVRTPEAKEVSTFTVDLSAMR